MYVMSRSKRMKPVMQVAENREQQAAREQTFDFVNVSEPIPSGREPGKEMGS